MKIFKSVQLFSRHFIIACAVLVFSAQAAYGWGLVGHHASAQIALDILTKQKSPALKQIKEILKRDDFVLASTWADEIRGSTAVDWKKTIWYHFEKMNDNDKYLSYLKDQTQEIKSRGGVLTAILASEMVLRDKKASSSDKNYALKFIIHFIGDIHQPLHSGRADDNGGNKIDVKWQGFDLSLHQIWDSQIIAFGHKNLFLQGVRSEQVKSYANFLIEKFKDRVLPNENKLKYDDWLNESLAPRLDAYKYKDEEASLYTARFLDVVDQRVFLSGVRIAYTMNRIFPGYNGIAAPTAAAQVVSDNFLNQVVSITGDLSQLIDLKPSPLKGP